VDLVTFVRQGANLWKVKGQLWQHPLMRLSFDPAISVVFSFSVPARRFVSDYRRRRLAVLGDDELAH